MPPGVLLVAFWLSALQAEGLYDPLRMITSVRIVQALFRAALAVLVGAILVQYFTSHRAYSRLLLLAFVSSSAVLLATWRLAFFRLQGFLSTRVPREGVLIVGIGEDARLMSERLTRYGAHFYQLRGFLAPAQPEPHAVEGPVLGELGDLRRVVNETRATLVILASRLVSRDEGMQLASHCAHMGLEVLQVPFTWGLVSARVEPAAVGELELVRIGSLSYPTPAQFVKRVFDLVAVLSGGALLLPFLAGIALAIKVHDGGPVLYVSQRSGKGGRIFPFYKFRSMVVDADKIRDQLPNEADGRLFKLTGDPRITPLGAFLRKYSVDELPQLLNVLKGEMNLVGPRPLPVSDLRGIEQDPEYWYWFEQRSRVNPGITGLWQVEGRSDLAFTAMVELDVRYIQHWSLFLDLQILLKTLPAVLRGRGAR
jgi:exopolysaccharide biosynthesis polyprenyl glycosylphosphotransferase